jgi:hypothetical protein
VKETLQRSPVPGHALRIVLDLTPQETAQEVRGRQAQLDQLQPLQERQRRLLALVGEPGG